MAAVDTLASWGANVFQSPSSSYLFSHSVLKRLGLRLKSPTSCRNRPQALTCFHTLKEFDWGEFEGREVAIALKLLPVFTQLLFLMQKTCAFLNPKILTSLFNPI